MFYYLLSGASEELARELFLMKMEEYQYLNQVREKEPVISSSTTEESKYSDTKLNAVSGAHYQYTGRHLLHLVLSLSA